MSPRIYKTTLLIAAVILLAVGGQFQKALNQDRIRLGFTPLPNDPAMPPVLALTTQVLGGFRGLIANALWVRANDMQMNDQYFEMVQLSRWITSLEPRFVQVWTVQAWNMAYNISVKFSAPEDRWRWVRHGIELLRDDALKYNPDEALIYRELAWFFQHKMGANLDDAHFYYKGMWAAEMSKALSLTPGSFNGRPDFAALMNPVNEEYRALRANLLEKYKLDPAIMKQVDDHYGPLDWRLPETHAIYWAYVGLQRSKAQDQVTLRRAIYQSMKVAFERGRIQMGLDGQPYLTPNLELIPNANKTYLEMLEMEPDPAQKNSIRAAHKNFLVQATYELYIHNRVQSADLWMKYLRKMFPGTIPNDVTLADFAITKLMEDMKSPIQVRLTSIIQGFVTQSYIYLIENQEDEANAYMLRAQEMHDAFMNRFKSGKVKDRLQLVPLDMVKKQVLDQLLDPKTGLSDEARAILKTKLGLPAETAPKETKPADKTP